jgi:hypothetical protein
MQFSSDPDEVRASALYNQFWYYGVELLPGVITTGQYAPKSPMLCDIGDATLGLQLFAMNSNHNRTA